MKNDIIPSKKPEPEAQATENLSVEPGTLATDELSSVAHSRWDMIAHVLKLLAVLIVLIVLATAAWYVDALRPVAPSDATRTRVRIESGTSSLRVGQLLHEKKLIRSELAFRLYTRIQADRSAIQAGTYSLSPSESTGDIVSQLVSGKVDDMTLTFYPGATLTDHTSKPEKDKSDVETILLRAGYSQAEITAAFNKRYDHPLFATKPSSADLEGYVYGETYNFDSSASVEQILTRTFDEFEADIKENNLVAGFKKQGLTLYEGITLASIIQREVPNPKDQRQVAQVFLLRLKEDKSLGSDVTYQYIADKMGVQRDPNLNSPYNTRRFRGLPPGPIAAPGLSALEAVANPARGDYLFFLSGDDDVTYYARTNEEHEANKRNHCAVKCSTN